MKFSIKEFFSKCDQIHSFLGIWSHLLKKSLMENFIFYCSVNMELSAYVFLSVPNMYEVNEWLYLKFRIDFQRWKI